MSSKPYNGGQWTEARFRSFIVSALRNAHGRWGPKAEANKRARTARGVYRCASCGEDKPATKAGVYKTGKKAGKARRISNHQVDHIIPVVDPEVGFTTWDDFIRRMFVEVDGYQVLCDDCHKRITAEERAIRNANKTKGR